MAEDGAAWDCGVWRFHKLGLAANVPAHPADSGKSRWTESTLRRRFRIGNGLWRTSTNTRLAPLKTVIGASLSRVQIPAPPLPPSTLRKRNHSGSWRVSDIEWLCLTISGSWLVRRVSPQPKRPLRLGASASSCFGHFGPYSGRLLSGLPLQLT